METINSLRFMVYCKLQTVDGELETVRNAPAEEPAEEDE